VQKQVHLPKKRAQRLKQERKDFFDHYSPEARQILDELQGPPRVLQAPMQKTAPNAAK
jgi:hypothetical protein